jgi:hypothetical protein
MTPTTERNRRADILAERILALAFLLAAGLWLLR